MWSALSAQGATTSPTRIATWDSLMNQSSHHAIRREMARN